MRLKYLFLFAFNLFFAALSGQKNNQDVTSYSFEVKLFEQSDSIAVNSEIKVNLSGLENTIELHLHPSMKIDYCYLNGVKSSFKRVGNSLFVNTDKKINQLNLSYRGIPLDGLIIGKNKNSNRTYFGDNWPNRAQYWLSVYDHPSDKAKLEFTVLCPEEYQVVANGSLQSITKVNKYNKYHYKTSYDIATKLMVIGVAKFEKQVLQNSPYTIASYSYPEDRMKVFEDYSIAPKICNYFESYIGRYPFDKLYNVQSTTKYGGMENAGCIFYDENSFDGKRSNEDLLAHEIAHQWFGNSVSEKDWQHIWLSEGFATFFENKYMRSAYGDELYQDILKSERSQILSFKNRYPKYTLIPSQITDLNVLLNPYSYQKGAWLLHMLECEIGQDLFQTVIRSFYIKFKGSNADTQDFIDEVERICKREMDDFFKPWLYSSALPAYQLSWNYSDGKIFGTLKQVQSEDVTFVNSIEIQIVYQDGSKEILSLRPSSKSTKFDYSTNKKPKQLIVDPANAVLKL